MAHQSAKNRVVKLLVLVATSQLVAGAAVLAQSLPPFESSQGQTVIYSPATGYAAFGTSLALDNGVLAVGAPGENSSEGAVYIYRYATDRGWTLEERLISGDDTLTYRFGNSVALARRGDSTLLAVGSFDGAFIYQGGYESWVRTQRLLEVEEARCCAAVALHDSVLTVTSGAYKFPIYVQNQLGVFAPKGAAIPETPTNPLGSPLLISEDRILTGNSGFEGNDQLRLFLFRRSDNGWGEEDVLIPRPGMTVSSAVAFKDSTIAIQSRPEECCDTVRFYSYTGTEWMEATTIDSPVLTRTNFGSSIALVSDLAIIGDELDSEAGPFAGAIHIYRRLGKNWSHASKVIPGLDVTYTRLGRRAIVSDGRFVATNAYDDGKPVVIVDLAVVLTSSLDEHSNLGRELIAYPNPFGSSVTLTFTIETPGHVSLTIVDILGRTIATPVDAYRGAGQHQVKWSPQGLAGGNYFAVLRSGATVAYNTIVR